MQERILALYRWMQINSTASWHQVSTSFLWSLDAGSRAFACSLTLSPVFSSALFSSCISASTFFVSSWKRESSCTHYRILIVILQARIFKIIKIFFPFNRGMKMWITFLNKSIQGELSSFNPFGGGLSNNNIVLDIEEHQNIWCRKG